MRIAEPILRDMLPHGKPITIKAAADCSGAIESAFHVKQMMDVDAGKTPIPGCVYAD